VLAKFGNHIHLFVPKGLSPCSKVNSQVLWLLEWCLIGLVLGWKFG